MAKRQKNTSLFQKELVNEALLHSFVKLNPKLLIAQSGNVYRRNWNSCNGICLWKYSYYS